MSMRFNPATCETAEADGFAIFNRGEYLCVEIPDGHSTISCITSQGQKITFAFTPYRENGPPQCCDVMHHTAERFVANGDDMLPCQRVICFQRRGKQVDLEPHDKDPCTLVCVIFQAPDPNDKNAGTACD